MLNMKNNLLKKGMVCLIIFFFIGASVLPIVTGNIGKSNVVEKELMKIKNIKQTLFDDSLGEEWTQTFGGTESDIGYSVEQTLNPMVQEKTMYGWLKPTPMESYNGIKHLVEMNLM
jgi:hypothetical protein